MKLVESILTKNPCYITGQKIKVKGIMLHSVGCPQPSAAVFIKNWNSVSYDKACVHAFIDGNDGTVYQTLPWNHRGWHGGGSCNDTHIGVEMCEPDCIKYTRGATFTCTDFEKARSVVKRTYESAVDLFAMLCKEYGFDPLEEGVILSHAEGYKKGIATNHGDPEHLWKQLKLEYTMDKFREDVKNVMGTDMSSDNKEDTSYPEKLTSGYYRVRKTWNDTQSQIGAYRILSNAKVKADESGYCVFDNDGRIIYKGANTVQNAFVTYRVRVRLETLNIRKGPGINYDTVGQFTGKGVFTIVDETKGQGATKWGLLKSYAENRDGWISLDFVEKL